MLSSEDQTHLVKKMKVADIAVSFPLGAAERLYDELKKILGTGKLTSSNVVTVLLSLMQVVEKYGDVKGIQKKAVILDALNHLIEDTLEGQEATDLKLLVQLTLPTVIDTFVSLDKKEIAIKLKKTCKKLFSCCGVE